MKKYYFPIIIYTLLSAICLGYVVLAFYKPLFIPTENIDLPKIVLGGGCFTMCVYVICRYINKDEDEA